LEEYYYYLYIYTKTSIKRNILTIKQNTSGSRSGWGLTSTPVQLWTSIRMCSISTRHFVAYAYWYGHRPLASAGFWGQVELFHLTAALPRTTNFIPEW